jgi:hypothetical protein
VSPPAITVQQHENAANVAWNNGQYGTAVGGVAGALGQRVKASLGNAAAALRRGDPNAPRPRTPGGSTDASGSDIEGGLAAPRVAHPSTAARAEQLPFASGPTPAELARAAPAYASVPGNPNLVPNASTAAGAVPPGGPGMAVGSGQPQDAGAARDAYLHWASGGALPGVKAPVHQVSATEGRSGAAGASRREVTMAMQYGPGSSAGTGDVHPVAADASVVNNDRARELSNAAAAGLAPTVPR